MAIKWDPSMSTGLNDIDNQHKQLVEKLNQLLEAMSQGKGRSEIGQILDFLGKYASDHFSKEEEYMTKYKCPAASENKKAHALFIQTFSSLQAKLKEEGPTPVIVLETKTKLVDWLVNHIKDIDVKLANSVKKE